MRTLTISAVLLLPLFFASAPAGAQVAEARVDGDEYRATVELPGGIAAELSVRFENVVGLDPSALGVSAQLVDPLSPSLLSRMPDITDISIPAAFPVLIQISPPVASGLAFEGVAVVELYTRNLKYTAGTPLRLYSAPAGGSFVDITDRVSGGSYRPRGSTGHFSDFLIVADLRALPTVVDGKFSMLSQLLQVHGNSIGFAARADLEQLLTLAQSQWAGGDPGSAVDTLTEFEAASAAAAAAGQVPRVWRASRDVDNIDGMLRSASRTLKFSLAIAVNQL